MNDQPRTIVPGIWSDVYEGRDDQGNARLKVTTKAGSPDGAGNTSRNTLMQEVSTAERNDSINVQFQYNVPIDQDSTDVDGDVSGTGTITHENSMAVVSAGTGVGYAYVESKDSIRYFPGHEFAGEMTAFALPSLDSPELNAFARWGIGDVGGSGDAMCFAVENGVFGAIFRSAGVPEFIPSSQFSHDKLDGTGPSGFDINIDNMDLYTFRGGWYGILPLQYGIFAQDYGYVTCHIIDRTNTQQKPHLSNATLPMFIEVGRLLGSGENIQVKSSSWRGGISGPTPKGTKADRTQVETVEEKAIPGGNVATPVISLRNNPTFQGKVNHVRVRYGTVALAVDGTKPVVWEVFKNGTLVGEVWTPKNTVASTVDYDTSATAYAPSQDTIGGTIMGKVSTIRINLFEGDVILSVYPGETITLTARSSNNTEVTTFFRWIEEF